MSILDLYNSNKTIVSMEFFPPRTENTKKSFGKILHKLAEVKPDFMTVTFGARGSTKEGSYETVKQIIKDYKIPTIAYIAGYGLGPDTIKNILNRYKTIGVETVFVIRGDKPQDENFIPHLNSFSYASYAIEFIKENFDLFIGCAGYPEGHIESENIETDVNYLKLKVEKGAKYVVSQYFYDNEYFFNYVKKCRAAGINVPIIPGIMPVYTIKMTNILSKICGTTITNELKELLDSVDSNDKEGILNLGIDFAFEQCKVLLRNGVPGLHFYTMNRSKSTIEIIKRLRNENLL